MEVEVEVEIEMGRNGDIGWNGSGETDAADPKLIFAAQPENFRVQSVRSCRLMRFPVRDIRKILRCFSSSFFFFPSFLFGSD